MGQLVRAVAAGRRSRFLFKTLKQVEIRFNPFDHRSTTARYALSPIGTLRLLTQQDYL